MQQPTNNKRPKNLVMQYAGLATQMMVAIGAAVFIGLKADNWLNFETPILIWVLPLFLIIGMLIKVIVDTGRKK